MYYYVSSVLYWCNEYIKDLILGVPNFNYAGGKFMLRLPAIFSNHMVFQREKNILLWGESDAQSVTAVIGDNKISTDVKDGKWEIELPPMEAGGPYELEVSDGNETKKYIDIMLGEVWLAGGQSNMELELQNSKNGKEVCANVKDEGVRYYYTPKVSWVGEELSEAEKQSEWQHCTPDTCKKWSAVAYYFAKKLSKELGVTVGIIGCNWGGTSASCWTSREFMEQETLLKPYLDKYDKAVKGQDIEEYIKAREDYIKYQAEFDKNVGHYYQTAENPTWDEAISLFGENQYPGPMGPRNETRPCGLYESLLKRVMPYTLRGFLYYQGEEDDHMPYTYYTMLSTLVRQWRHDWRDDELPFMCVQLPMFKNDGEPDYHNWPFIREAQMRLFKTVKNTGIAVILDKGEYGNIHPVEKDVVGERLCEQALYHVYKKNNEKSAFGPVYNSYETDKNKMILHFEHADGGMECRGQQLSGFEIAGDDKKYYAASAEICGNTIVVSAEDVEKPKYARYCWTNYAEVTLYGKNGIPAAPFRTSYDDGAVATGSRNEGVWE